jgi:hypothetical protein
MKDEEKVSEIKRWEDICFKRNDCESARCSTCLGWGHTRHSCVNSYSINLTSYVQRIFEDYAGNVKMAIAVLQAHYISFAERIRKFEAEKEVCAKPTQSQVPKVLGDEIQVHHEQTSTLAKRKTIQSRM